MDQPGAESLGRDLFSLYTHTHLPLFPLPQVRCSDYDSDGSHDLIGTFYTSLAQLQAVPVSASPAQGCCGGPKGLQPQGGREGGLGHLKLGPVRCDAR